MILLSAPLNVSAKLAMNKFDDMVSRSEIIVEATPILIEGNKTTFEINRFYKGKVDGTQITITRSNEVHDQKIFYIGKHILFLTHDSKVGWTSASYGRGYWPLLPVTDIRGYQNKKCDSAVPYDVYPFNMVSPSEHLQAKLMKVYYQYLKSEINGIEQKVYCRNQIESAVKHLTKKMKLM